MPKSPESEGSRLITLKQIEQEHGVSRSALHNYRRSASFPQPVPAEGSTKIQYDAREVAAWFEANPPQQGRRTDLASRPQQGDPAMSAPARGGLTDRDYEDRELLLSASDVIQRRWPDEYPTLVRDLRDLVDTISEEAADADG
ncbi:AlpA family phage regulatory protein [Streptomyces nigra]|uniref:helix-turn-helix transcriptional regulator n=1 Tax=Streptomyces nigra TaxID=1827580 RepID=UPI003453BF7A